TMGAPAPGSPVVAKVGTVTITAAEVERRLALVPPFQLRAFGSTPAEIRRAFLERVLVREALRAQGRAERGLDAPADVERRMRGVLRSAILAKLRAEVLQGSPVDQAEIKAYYEKNAAKFRSPERVALWLIATRQREEAADVIAELRKDPSPKSWTALCRTRSI